MSNYSPTIGQTERLLAQNIRKRYRTVLGHNPKKISCKINGTQLTIIIQETVTQLEKFLLRNKQVPVAHEVRSDLGMAFLPELKATIQECLSVKVLDIGSIPMEKANSTAVVAILSQCLIKTIKKAS